MAHHTIAYIACIVFGSTLCFADSSASLKFDFKCALFSHVPKTGGTTMRRVLEALAEMRNQKVEAYYPVGSMVCRNITNQLEKDNCMAKHLHEFTGETSVAFDFLYDKCQNNQIVFGHAIKDGFAEFHHISNQGLKWVAMIREPAAWIRSYYKHLHDDGYVGGSFEEWIQSGKANMKVRQLLSYFMSGDKEKSTERRLEERLSADNVLTLFTENYTRSIDRLVNFLGASSSERDAMVMASKQQWNVRPPKTYNLSLSQSASDRFMELLKPLRIAYNLAEKMMNTSS